MSIQSEQIEAQKKAFDAITQSWHRHLMGPVALQALFDERDQLKAELEAEKRLSAAIRRDLMRAEGVQTANLRRSNA